MNKLDIISEIIKKTDCNKCNHYIKGTNDCFITVKDFKECLFFQKLNKELLNNDSNTRKIR